MCPVCIPTGIAGTRMCRRVDYLCAHYRYDLGANCALCALLESALRRDVGSCIIFYPQGLLGAQYIVILQAFLHCKPAHGIMPQSMRPGLHTISF